MQQQQQQQQRIDFVAVYDDAHAKLDYAAVGSF
jgi:hypothetical protein